MPRSILLLAVFAMFLVHFPEAVAQDSNVVDKPLSAYRDKNRVLLLFASNPQDAMYLEQLRLWTSDKAGFDDRQLVVAPVFAGASKAAGDTPAALAKRYGVDPKGFALVLIGKDGRDAFRASKPLKPETIYDFIDAMPMRRTEMRRTTPSPASPTPIPAPTRPQKPDLDHDE